MLTALVEERDAFEAKLYEASRDLEVLALLTDYDRRRLAEVCSGRYVPPPMNPPFTGL